MSDADPPGRASTLPWEGRPAGADVVILGGIALSGLYGLALLPVVPALVGSHPLLLELLSGSTVATVTMGALARVGDASLVVAVLAALPGCMAFDWLFWWAGRRWGHRGLQLMLGRRGGGGRGGVGRGRGGRGAARMTGAVERLAGRYSWLGVLVAYYLPLPNVVVYAAAGIGGMRLRTFLLLDLVGTLLWIGLLVGLGYGLGQRAVDVVHAVDHYSLLLSLAVLALVVVLQVRAARSRR